MDESLFLTFNLENNFEITRKYKINIKNDLLPTCVRVINLGKWQSSILFSSLSPKSMTMHVNANTLMPVILGGTCPRNTLSLSNLNGESLNPLRALSTAGSTVVNRRSLTYLMINILSMNCPIEDN